MPKSISISLQFVSALLGKEMTPLYYINNVFSGYYISQKDNQIFMDLPANKLQELYRLAYDQTVLTEREIAILLQRYDFENNTIRTLSTIGATFSLARTSIWQFEKRAFRKLRSSANFKLIVELFLANTKHITVGGYTAADLALATLQLAQDNSKLVNDLQELQYKHDQLASRFNEGLNNWLSQQTKFTSEEIIDQRIVPIKEISLTTRSYNCLLRAGITHAVDLSYVTEKEISSINNIGKRSLEEIKRKAEDIGYPLAQDIDYSQYTGPKVVTMPIHGLRIRYSSYIGSHSYCDLMARIAIRRSGIATFGDLTMRNEKTLREILKEVYGNSGYMSEYLDGYIAYIKSSLRDYGLSLAL
jgi:hypothetical protein